MTDPPEPDPTSLLRAQRMAREALEGTAPRGGEPEPTGPASQRATDSPARISRTLAHVLDDLVGVPGTGIRFGVDPLLSVIPVAGTAMGGVMGAVILYDAVRLRAPISVLARMVGNYVIDWLLGLPPFVGALFDAAYRSNRKNLHLLERTIADREQVRKASLWYWLGVAMLVVVVISVLVAVPVGLLIWLDGAVTGR